MLVAAGMSPAAACMVAVAEIPVAVTTLLMMVAMFLRAVIARLVTVMATAGATGMKAEQGSTEKVTVAETAGQAGLTVGDGQKKLRDFLCIICGLH